MMESLRAELPMDHSAHRFLRARYLGAAHLPTQLPKDSGREVAFAGRSNAGKSSALNAICGQSRLARTSKTPGRTQQLVSFEIDAAHRLVDLPGYGYARVPDALRAHWRTLVDGYLNRRRSLVGVVLVMDARHPLKPFDRDMLNWTAARALPCHILLTKADKLSRGAAATTLRQLLGALPAHPAALSAQLFSSTQPLGLEQARATLEHWLYGEPLAEAQATGDNPASMTGEGQASPRARTGPDA